MNLNVRELIGHVEYESRSYYPAFTAEIEICASTIWHLLQHLKDNVITERLINFSFVF